MMRPPPRHLRARVPVLWGRPFARRPKGAWDAPWLVPAERHADRGASSGPNQVYNSGERTEEQKRGTEGAGPLFGCTARDHSRETPVPEAARRGRLIGEPLALRLGEGTISLLARAGFATVDAGILALVGPSGQEANIAVFAEEFLVSVHFGGSPAPAVAWGEVHGGLELFLEAALGRQFDKRLRKSLECWARQRTGRLAIQRAGVGTRRRARRRAAWRGERDGAPAGGAREANSPGLSREGGYDPRRAAGAPRRGP